jgi:hypothetical protein
MASTQLHDDDYRRDLDDRLVLRWSTAADTDELTRFYSNVFRSRVSQPPNQRIAAWIRTLMSGKHPLLGPTDFALVEDRGQRKIVAAANLMSQTWDYHGVSLPIGRPEVVGSEAEHRQRGLIRAIFELIHARSVARGHLLQAITGIHYYYRLFGYEYALDLGGGYSVRFAEIPALKAPAAELFSLREAHADDLPEILALYERERSHARISTQIDAEYWSFIVNGGLPPLTDSGWRTQMIIDGAQQVVGYLLTHPRLWGTALAIKGLMVKPDVSLHAVLPSVLRAAHALALTLPLNPGDPPPVEIRIELGRWHPLYAALGQELSAHHNRPYAWYVRVPDLPALMRRIAPVLERRLAESVLVGYSGEIKINLYRGGLRLAFDKGRLRAAEDWQVSTWNEDANAGSPPLVFLQLVFGHRSLEQLRDMFPDVWASGEHAILLHTLFPPQPSFVVPLD